MSWDEAYDFARGMNYATKGAMNIRDMIREDQKYKQAEQYKDDVNSNMAMLSNAGPDNQQATAMVGTPEAQAEARKRYASDLQVKDSIADNARTKQVESAYKSIMSDLMKNGQNFQQNRGDFPVDIYNEAMNKAVTSYTKTEQGKMLLAQTRKAAHEQNWAVFSQYKNAIQSSIAEGNNDAAINLIERMSVDTPMPYSLKWNAKEGAFDQLYMHSGSGNWERVGSVSIDQAKNMIDKTSKRQFAINEFSAKEATRQWNNDAWLPAGQTGSNGKDGRTQIFNKDGQDFWITPQKDPNRPNSVMYIVTGQDNSQQVFKSQAELMKAGFRFEDLARVKNQMAIAISDQNLSKAKAETAGAGVKSKKDALDYRNKLTKQYKDDLSFVLTPFVKPGTDLSSLFSDDGNPTPAAENALQSAMTFVKNNPDPQQLDGLDRMKWAKGKQAIQLYNGMSQNIVSNYNQQRGESQTGGPNTPPIKGARKAKDGEWYVQKDGKWAKVVKNKVDTGDMKSAHTPSVAPGVRSNIDKTNAYPQSGQTTTFEYGDQSKSTMR